MWRVIGINPVAKAAGDLINGQLYRDEFLSRPLGFKCLSSRFNFRKSFMERAYRMLNQQVFEAGDYKLVPIRHEDRYDIMKWRNEQVKVLRQKGTLTAREQDHYFDTVVNNLFSIKNPRQLLFSFLKNNVLIGYGGLVHIDWDSLNGEISFLLDTKLMHPSTYITISNVYFPLITQVAYQANLKKVYTYGYDLDSFRFVPLYRNGFELEAYLHEHVSINGVPEGVRIYSFKIC